MQPRQLYHEKLLAIRDEVLKMAAMARKAVEAAITALMQSNSETAQHVIDGDERINLQEELIEERCVIIIATEQPVAGELRFLISTIKIIRDLERIGDYACHLAKAALSNIRHFIKIPEDIPVMTGICLDMLNTAMASYFSYDLQSLSRVRSNEELVDQKYLYLLRELSLAMQQEPDNIRQLTPLILVAKYLERLADHIMDICEEIIYINLGKRKERT